MEIGIITIEQWDTFWAQDKAARKQARRCRVRRQSQDLTGQEIVFDEDYLEEEKYSMKEVQRAVFTAGFESFSDDEAADFSDMWMELDDGSFQ